MFSRVFKADLAELESTVPGGKFPDAEEVAEVVRDMVLNPGEQGATRYIEEILFRHLTKVFW